MNFRRRAHSLALAVALPLVAAPLGCKTDEPAQAGAQSLAEAMKLICEAPSNLRPDVQPAERPMAIAQYLHARVSNVEARKLMASMSDVPKDEVGSRLRKVAQDVGLKQCEFADLWSMSTPTE